MQIYAFYSNNKRIISEYLLFLQRLMILTSCFYPFMGSKVFWNKQIR